MKNWRQNRLCCEDNALNVSVTEHFCVSVWVRHKEIWDLRTSAFMSVCVCVWERERVCVCSYCVYVYVCFLLCHPFHQLWISFLTWLNLSWFSSDWVVHRFISHTHTHNRCSHMRKHKGTKLTCIFMNVCAIFGRCVILKLVYTGIILLELNVSIVYVYKWLIGILDISIAEQQKQLFHLIYS